MNIYKINDIGELIKDNSYVGRGIVIGTTEDSTKAAAAYFIMGRSENSRNRVFTENDGEIKTEPFDISKVEDPSLIIYNAVRMLGDSLIVTNGDQTDTIVKRNDFTKGLMEREYEPDEPNYTPRISAVIHKDGSFEMSILKRRDGRCRREFFRFEGVSRGKGYFISTYRGDGNPLPSFAGEPMEIDMPTPEQVWNALNSDNKVSLYANVKGEVKIFNKNLGD